MTKKFDNWRKPQELAEILAEIYEISFGGKTKGRFRTARKNIRKLSNLPILTEDYIQDVSIWLRRVNLILIDLDHSFAILPGTAMRSVRRVPENIISQFLMVSEDEDEGESEDDD
jgi:hypothetical protein